MVDRLADDHANAEALAAGLAQLPGVAVEPVDVRTNIVFFRLNGADSTRLLSHTGWESAESS